jgi:hypothetical protein
MPAQATGAEILRCQNGERHRLLLAAFSEAYGYAKTILAIQVTATVGGAVLASVVSANWPGTKSWTVLYAVAVSLVDTFILERMQARYRKLGSQLQELFDGDLFGLSWNQFAAGDPPTPEEIAEQGEAFLQKYPDAPWLRDWYPAEIRGLPLSYAALVCQRTNCWWDERLRRRYLVGLVTLLMILTGGLTVYGLARQVTLEQFFLSVLAPLWPALLWGFREAFKQHDAAETAGKLRMQVEKLWTRCLEQPPPVDELRWEIQAIQTEIQRGRANRPLVFNWVHHLFRSRHQHLMQTGAADIAARLQGQPRGA